MKGGALAKARAQGKLWVYLGTLPVIIATIKRPAGKNNNYSEAFGDLLATAKINLGRQVLCCN